MSVITNLYILHTLTISPFLQNEKSTTKALHNFGIVSQFSGLKTNKSKCEVVGIEAMKGVKVALCGVECVNLLTSVIKILGI